MTPESLGSCHICSCLRQCRCSCHDVTQSAQPAQTETPDTQTGEAAAACLSGLARDIPLERIFVRLVRSIHISGGTIGNCWYALNEDALTEAREALAQRAGERGDTGTVLSRIIADKCYCHERRDDEHDCPHDIAKDAIKALENPSG